MLQEFLVQGASERPCRVCSGNPSRHFSAEGVTDSDADPAIQHDFARRSSPTVSRQQKAHPKSNNLTENSNFAPPPAAATRLQSMKWPTMCLGGGACVSNKHITRTSRIITTLSPPPPGNILCISQPLLRRHHVPPVRFIVILRRTSTTILMRPPHRILPVGAAARRAATRQAQGAGVVTDVEQETHGEYAPAQACHMRCA